MLDALSGWLREQRLARGWSVAEMGRQLRLAAKATGDHTIPGTAILASYVRRWEAGKIAPTERYRLHYCAAFGIPPTELGPDRPQAAFGIPPTELGPHRPQTQPPETADAAVRGPSGDVAAGVLVTAPDARLPTDVADWRGEFSGYRDVRKGHHSTERTEQFAADSPDLWMAIIAEESLDFGEWADTSNIGDATLEHYAAQVRQLASDYQHAAPYPLLLETKRLRDRVFGKLQGHQRPAQTRDLYLIAAQVCGMLAWMSGDLGYQRAAQTQAWTAWVCAEQANHDGARAWVRATQSKLAYWDARYVESAQLADDGLRYPSADSGQAMLALVQARALARLGRDEDAAGALARARTRLEQAGPDEVGGLWGVSQARYHHLAGSTHLWRQDPGQVLAETGQALELFEVTPAHQRYYGAEVGTRIDEAQAHLLSQDLDGANAALRPVLALAPENRNEPLSQHLGHVRQALADPAFRDAALARELQEEIETYSRESIVHDLRD